MDNLSDQTAQPLEKPSFPPPHMQKRMLNTPEVNRMASEAITSNNPFLLARFGGVESEIIKQIILKRQLDLDPKYVERADKWSGVVPSDRQVFRACAVEQLAAGLKTDILAVWGADLQMDLESFVTPPPMPAQRLQPRDDMGEQRRYTLDLIALGEAGTGHPPIR